MSDYVKLTLAATTLACRDAGVNDDAAFLERCAAVLGTMHGSANYCSTYYGQIVRDGMAAANPLLFAEGVPNAAAAHLSMMLSLKEACQTVIGTRTAGLDAMSLAVARIGSGAWDRAMVGAGEEHCELVCDAYRHGGLGATRTPPNEAPLCGPVGQPLAPSARKFLSGAGAVTFILESADSVRQRSGRMLGRVVSCAARRGAPRYAGRTIGRVLAALGDPPVVTGSACGTWIDRAEAMALRRNAAVRQVVNTYGRIAESFSVSPLVGLAVALGGGNLPVAGSCCEDFASICTDFTGCCSGVRVERV